MGASVARRKSFMFCASFSQLPTANAELLQAFQPPSDAAKTISAAREDAGCDVTNQRRDALDDFRFAS